MLFRSSQKTANKDVAIIGKKFPMIQLKMAASVRSKGPTKKKIPTTAGRPEAPPQPMRIMLNVKVLITKPTRPIGWQEKSVSEWWEEGGGRLTVGFAKRA